LVTDLGPVTLKSGEEAQLLQIIAPESAWTDRLLPFLAHKGEPWIWPMKLALEEGIPGIRMSFFELLLDGDIAGNITTVDAGGLGMLQHVFTNPDHRRKGICQLLMQAACDDFAGRGGRAMYLGTGYDSPPFWIYHSFGFRSIQESGAMKWLPDAQFEQSHFAPGETSVREVQWGDWPALTALYQSEQGWYLRGFHFGQYGHASYEGVFPAMQGQMSKGAITQVKVLVKSDGAVMGHALLATQRQWRGDPYLLDCFVHPRSEADAAKLLGAITWPTDRKVQCYCDAEAAGRMAALQATGFEQEAVLKRQIQRGDEWLDVAVYAR
jgi:GNAT superfamily N-acetyltransferase